jgi:hypothetical protein
MKYITVIASVFLLQSCAILGLNDEPNTVVSYKYVSKSAPIEMYELPVKPQLNINDTSTQKDVAIWLTELDEYIQELELKIKNLKLFFESTPLEKTPKPNK